jgi:multidrug efflux pump subunit AcrA (membrane-fusion protein)
MFYLDKKEFLMSPRVLRRLGVLAGLLVLAAVIPWSRETISGEAVIQPIRTLRVEAPEDGIVVRTIVREGDRVQKGQPLLEMSSSGLAQELGALTAEEIGLRGQESAGIADDDPRAAFQAGETGRAVAAEIVRDRSRRERLLLRSPVSGAVLTPSVDDLAGKYVHAGATLLEVGDARQFKAEIPVTERLVAQIPLGTPVTVQLRSRPLALLHGTVASVSAAAEGARDTASREEKGLLPSDVPEKFTVVATFPGSDNDLVTGMKGNAKIYLVRRSFVGRGWLILKHWVERIVW